MSYKKTIEIFDKIIILEMTIGELYQLCSQKWEADKDFWLNLSAQENAHAEFAKEMKQEFLNKTPEFTLNPNFSIIVIDSIILYISGIITKLKKDLFTKNQMLIIAHDTENSMIESNYQRIVTTKNPEYLKRVNILIQQTQEHKKLISDKIITASGL